jgi:hypothetical protein
VRATHELAARVLPYLWCEGRDARPSQNACKPGIESCSSHTGQRPLEMFTQVFMTLIASGCYRSPERISPHLDLAYMQTRGVLTGGS